MSATPGITFSKVPSVTGSINFDGSSYFSVDTAMTALPILNNSYTIEAFILTSNLSIMGIVGWGDYGTPNAVNAFRTNNYDLINYWWANDLTSAGQNIANNQWNHVVAQFDGTYRRIYVNGIMAAQDTPGPTHTVTNVSDLTIGYSGTGSAVFNGLMSNIRIINGVAVYAGTDTVNPNFQVPQQALTATQSASTNISAITTGQCALLLATPNNGNAFVDTSGNGYTLTAHGNPTANSLTPFGGVGIGIQQNGGKNILVGVPQITFTVNPGDITFDSVQYNSSTYTAESSTGFTSVGGPTGNGYNIANGVNYVVTGSLLAQMTAIQAAHPFIGSDPYAWSVSWTTGGTGVARVSFYVNSGTSSITIAPVDTTYANWQTDYIGAIPLKAGTFEFPATFTLYNPTLDLTNGGSGWC